MAKSIKNYTSTIPASTSMARIEDMLVEAGARDIHKSYDQNMQCTAIIFVMVVPNVAQPMHFKLPARIDACFEAMWKLYEKGVKRPQDATRKTLREQAARTAWKIIHDWVEMQLTLIQLDQAEPMQVFLPYVYNPGTGETFFEHAKKGSYKLLDNK
jgi:hypothetical protein